MQLFKYPKAPLVTRYTSGSGTHTTASGCLYMIVEAVGGGSSGLAGQTSAGGSVGTAGAGGNTTFGSSLITCNGGSAPSGTGSANGGTATVSAPAVTLVSQSGGRGGYAQYTNDTGINQLWGGYGGQSFFAGGAPAVFNAAGANGIANTGAGGGGGGGSGIQNTYSGPGGSAGGYAKAMISQAALAATYAYAVGAGGTYTAGAGNAAGNGAAGLIIVTEYFS